MGAICNDSQCKSGLKAVILNYATLYNNVRSSLVFILVQTHTERLACTCVCARYLQNLVMLVEYPKTGSPVDSLGLGCND